jgi:hypothetical protein
MIQFQLLVLISWSVLLNMVIFSLEILHHVEVTLDLNIELSEVTPLKGMGLEEWREG